MKDLLVIALIVFLVIKGKRFWCPILNQYIKPECNDYENKVQTHVETRVSYPGSSQYFPRVIE